LIFTFCIKKMDIKRIIVGPLQTNCYLLVDSGELAVIDPGDNAAIIEKEILALAAKVKFIINTHNHFDHTGANTELKNKFGVKIVKNLKEGEILAVGNLKLKVVQTPGHTKNSICLLGGEFLFSGDTLFRDGIGRTDLEGGSDKDMAESLRKLDELTPQGFTVYPGHGDIFIYKKGMALMWLEYLT